MSVALNASACPPSYPIATTLIDTTDGTTDPLVSVAYVFGETETLPGKLTKNAKMVDAIARSCHYSILKGLSLAIVGGMLQLTISAGQAMIDGPVTLAADTTIAVVGSGTYYIWFLRDGTFDKRTNLTTPAIPGVYLGQITTSGSAVTNIDTSGVVYNKAGILMRSTSDSDAPTDTPPSLSLLTITAGGTYLWDGANHSQLPSHAKPLSTDKGGTGATTAAAARANLGITALDPYTYSSATLTTTTGAAQTIDTITPPDDQSTTIEVDIAGNKSTHLAGAGYKLLYYIRKHAGAVVAIFGAGAVSAYSFADDPAYGAALVISGGDVLVQVTGKTGETLNWTSHAKLMFSG